MKIQRISGKYLGIGAVTMIIIGCLMSISDSAGTKSKLQIKKERMLAKFAQEIEMTKDPKLGYVPFDRLLEARNYVRTLIRKMETQRGAISGINWQNLGPNNVGGRTRAVMFDPNDGTNKRVFAGAVSGGIWKNEDITVANTPWTKIDDFMENLTVTTMAADPNNSMIFYAGTGEAYSGVTPGMGIFKSTDGGSTWSHLSSTSTYKYITEIVVRNEGGTSVVYAGSKRQYVGEKLEGGANTFLGASGLFRSADGGSTWSQVIPNNDDGNPPTVDDIGLDASGHLWASTGTNALGNKGGDIFECTDANCDGIAKFTKKYDASANGHMTVERTVIALAPNSGDSLYAVAANSNGNTDVEFFIRSYDGGSTWFNVTIPLNVDPGTCATVAGQHFTREQGTYDLVMTVHPLKAKVVLLGGIDMYRTTDGFATTAHIGSWYQGTAPCDQEIHADHHAIVFRPGAPNEVAFGNDGGVYYSSSAGNSTITAPTFVHHVTDYNVSQLYAADISPTAGAAEYLAGLQDNGTQDWDSGMGQATSEAVGGDGAYCHIDQDAPGTQIGAYIYNDFTITTNDWSSKTQIAPTPQTGRFINPSDYDDANNILYSASGDDQLCKLTGIGTTNTLTDAIAVGGATLGGKKATTIRVDRNTSTTIYIGTDAGKVFKIENANGGTLTSSDISTGLPTGWISSIDVQKGNSNHMLVTLSNYGVASVWESTNGGISWTNVEGNLPDIPVRWGIFSPANIDHALLATDLGIWSTDDIDGASTNWGVTNTGLANVRTDMLKWRMSDSTVVVATHGRGLYTYKFGSAGGCPPTLIVSDNPANGSYVAGDTITTNPLGPVQVTTMATFDAGNAINLNALFEVTTGAVFEVKLDGCN